ncbi:MAG: alcohol dehydrogenase catalytic domain-containing protein [Acidimicrobiales bacterium]
MRVRPASFPQVLGNDFAGIVDEVGEAVPGLAVGDEVLGYCNLSAHAELIVGLGPDGDQLPARPQGAGW